MPLAFKTTAYFISDAHLGNNHSFDPRREAWLLQFLRQIQERASHLFIVGDLFDFWIEYDHAIRPDYFNVLWALKNLRESGTQIHYLAGNHDFALGPFLQQHLGLHLHRQAVTMVLQKQRLFISHGNGMLSHQSRDRWLQNQLASPRWQKLYKLLHPSLGVPLGNAVSRLSRYRNNAATLPQWAARYRHLARRYLQQDCDMVIFGHTHWPEIHHWQIGSRIKTYCNTGEWLQQYTYATLHSGHLRLWRFHPHHPPSELLPQS